jgi:predicted HNH restriction endonuclease
MCAPKRTKLSVALGFTKKDKDFARICREHARNSLKKTNGLKSCSICGFSEFVEACHILPVKDFELDVPIRVINHPSNLVGLCPNCHWCYDHGKLSLPKN